MDERELNELLDSAITDGVEGMIFESLAGQEAAGIANIMSLAAQAFAYLLDGDPDRLESFAAFLREHSLHKGLTADDVAFELGRAGIISLGIVTQAMRDRASTEN